MRGLQLTTVPVLFLILLFLGVTPADGGAAGVNALRARRTLGTAPGAVLYSVSGISVDSRNMVYVTDMLDYSVKMFDGGGACVGKVGRRGAGPGEFRSPALTAVVGERLLVLQTGESRVQVFDTDLRYVCGFVVRGGMPVDIAPDFPRGVAIAFYSDTSAAAVLRYDRPEAREPVRVLLPPTGKSHPLYGAVRIAVCRDGTLIAAYLFMNRVELYDARGRFLRRFSLGVFPPCNQPADDALVPEETYFRKVVVDASGRILLLGGNRAPHPGRDVFICRRDGSLLRTVLLPSKSRLIVRGERNTIYATDESGSRVEQYVIP